MRKLFFNKKGSGNILSFVVISPILLWVLLFMILSGDFYLDTNNFNNVVNEVMDQALVEGQFTTELKTFLTEELTNKGFSTENLVIEITPAIADDGNNSTYVARGQEMEIVAYSNDPHPFYNIIFRQGDESRYYIGTRIRGMSEKW